MIVDTSALMAILNDEPEAISFLEIMLRFDGPITISAGNWAELGVVLVRRRIPDFDDHVAQIMTRCRITIEPVSVAQADLARDAYRRYGRGTGHPARLNYGDCFAYALARDTGRPLLFKGDDFGLTDIRAAA